MSNDENLYNFPYEPYPQQIQIMTELFNTIENRKIGIFESPTGTGKSLSVLCSSLSWILKNQENEIQQLINHKLEIKKAENESQTELDWVKAFDKKQKLNLKLTDKIEELEKKNKIYDKIKEIKSKRIYKEKNEDENVINYDRLNKNIDDEFIVNYDSDETFDEGIDKEKEGSITKIYYCSRTHSQLSQVLKELLKTKLYDKIVTCSVGSRQNLCINRSVNQLKSINLINEKCLDLQKPPKPIDENTEPMRKKPKQSSNNCCSYKSTTKIVEMSKEIIQKNMDIEDLFSTAMKIGGCPFYSVRQTLNKAHLVLMPYQNLLNPAARLASEIDLSDNIVIVDEAHNLPDTISSVNSVKLSIKDIDTTLKQLNEYFTKYLKRLSNKNLWYLRQIITIVKNLQEFLYKFNNDKETMSMSCVDFLFRAYLNNFKLDKLLNYFDKSKLAFKMQNAKRKSSIDDRMELQMKKNKSSSSLLFGNLEDLSTINSPDTNDDRNNEGGSNALLIVKNFLTAIFHSLDGKILVECGQSLIFLVVDPGKYLIDIVAQCRSVIVIGGTMQPFSEFTDRLFKVAGCSDERIHTFSCDHVINASEQMKIMTLGTGPTNKTLKFTFENRNDNTMIKESGELIYSVLSCCPNGSVVFFPSYAVMNSMITYWKTSNIFSRIEKLKSVFIELKQIAQSEQVMRSFSLAAKSSRGAVLFAVIGAKMSEGINFGDELARIVIVIGIPYPQINNPVLQEKMKFLEQQYKSEIAQTMYENLAMKAVNQAIGRAIRHKNDYSAVLLLDIRYGNIARISQKDIVNNGKLGLPQWMKNAVSIHTMTESVLTDLKIFFNKMKGN